MFIQILILVASLAVLAKSAGVVITNLIKIANSLRLSTFVVSFFILGVATSMPELFVGINSIIEKTPQLSLGNLIGESIILLTLITGLAATITGKVILSASFKKGDLVLLGLIIILPAILLLDARLTRIDAMIMFAAWGIYTLRVYRERHKLSHPIMPKKRVGILRNFVFLALGLIALAAAANFAVNSAHVIAESLKIPIFMIGILIFSLGTSFPELALTLSAIKKKQKMIVLGNVLGSATTNTLIVAIVAFIQPYGISDMATFAVSVFFLTLGVIVFSSFIKSKNQVSRFEGVVLLSIYTFFVIFEILSKLV